MRDEMELDGVGKRGGRVVRDLNFIIAKSI